MLQLFATFFLSTRSSHFGCAPLHTLFILRLVIPSLTATSLTPSRHTQSSIVPLFASTHQTLVTAFFIITTLHVALLFIPASCNHSPISAGHSLPHSCFVPTFILSGSCNISSNTYPIRVTFFSGSNTMWRLFKHSSNTRDCLPYGPSLASLVLSSCTHPTPVAVFVTDQAYPLYFNILLHLYIQHARLSFYVPGLSAPIHTSCNGFLQTLARRSFFLQTRLILFSSAL
ncbi:MAG: hypothetical protein BYD32DRAFT_141883 [Podila humilis]|nr:MAG: hypothetical protein BYD32DRAFT_141883 [Podila humilis]